MANLLVLQQLMNEKDTRIAELEADRSKAWETCQKAVERGMALEAELRTWESLGRGHGIDHIVTENKRLRESLAVYRKYTDRYDATYKRRRPSTTGGE